MATNGIMTGIDQQLVILTPQGSLQPSGTTGFNSRAKDQMLDHKGINGKNKYAYLPMGWEGDITLDRGDSVADDYFSNIAALYYAGQDIGVATVTQYITEAGGAQTIYRYDGVVFTFSDAGNWTGDGKVTQKIGFMASTRTKVQ